jgi:hypothetical protein
MPKKYPTVFHRIHAELQKEYDNLATELNTDWFGQWIDNTRQQQDLVRDPKTFSSEDDVRLSELAAEAKMLWRKAQKQNRSRLVMIDELVQLQMQMADFTRALYYVNITLPPFNFHYGR